MFLLVSRKFFKKSDSYVHFFFFCRTTGSIPARIAARLQTVGQEEIHHVARRGARGAVARGAATRGGRGRGAATRGGAVTAGGRGRGRGSTTAVRGRGRGSASNRGRGRGSTAPAALGAPPPAVASTSGEGDDLERPPEPGAGGEGPDVNDDAGLEEEMDPDEEEAPVEYEGNLPNVDVLDRERERAGGSGGGAGVGRSSTVRRSTKQLPQEAHDKLLDLIEKEQDVAEHGYLPKDDEEVYVLSLVPALKKLSEQRRSELKLKIHELVHRTLYPEPILGRFDENRPRTPSIAAAAITPNVVNVPPPRRTVGEEVSISIPNRNAFDFLEYNGPL